MGKVEKAVRDLMVTSAVPAFTTSALCQRIYGEVTKAKRVSMLRIMHRLAAAEPAWEVVRDPEDQGSGAQNVLFNAASAAGCASAFCHEVEPDRMGDPQVGGTHATYMHRRALLLVAGDSEGVAALEAARAEYLAQSQRDMLARMRAATGVKTPAEIDAERVRAAAQALIAVAVHRNETWFRMQVDAVDGTEQWHITCPRYVSSGEPVPLRKR